MRRHLPATKWWGGPRFAWPTLPCIQRSNAMAMMRAKMRLDEVSPNEDGSENLVFRAVGREDIYPEDGSDENNTYAKFTPNADLNMTVNNEKLYGKFRVGQEYYVDFTMSKDVAKR